MSNHERNERLNQIYDLALDISFLENMLLRRQAELESLMLNDEGRFDEEFQTHYQESRTEVEIASIEMGLS